MITLYNIRPKGFNVGNDAIYIGLKYFIYNAFGEMVNLICLPATSKYESHAKAGFNAKTVYEMNRFGDGVILGGGNLYENGELDVNLDALDKLEIPMMIFSVSRGRIYNKYSELIDRTDVMPDRIIKNLNEKACISLARDKVTYDYLQKLGFNNTKLGGCPTIFLDKSEFSLAKRNKLLEKTALISIRNPLLMNVPLKKQAQIRDDILSIVKLLRENGYCDIKLLCHDIRDIEFATSFYNLEFVYTEDVYAYLNMIRSCSINITYRLHSALPCVAFGTPMIKISYDERACSLMETLGLGKWNINMIEESNVLEEVKKRFQQKKYLFNLKEESMDKWIDKYDVMSTAFKYFAQKVYKEANR